MELPNRLGRYRLIRRLARGGMGEVHLGVLEAAGGVRRHAAIKVLIEATPKAQAALLAEARLAASLSHPNVVQLLDAGVDQGHAWFAMEYVAGLSLAELFESGHGHIPPWVAARIVADACAALHAVHEATDETGRPLGIVHRDVTPHNILVSSNGFVKLVDFGIARSAFQHALTTTGIVRGKLGYLSPEQTAGTPADRRSDIFSLGILLWELLAGERLFKQATEAETIAATLRGDVRPIRDAVPEVPPSLERIAERALLKDPGSRYATALEMQRALEAAIQQSGSSVGAHEVAQLLASVAPDRVKSPEPTDDKADTTGPHTVPTDKSRTRSRPFRWRNAGSLAAALVAGAALAAVAFSFSRSEQSSGAQAVAAPRQPVIVAPPEAKPRTEPAQSQSAPIATPSATSSALSLKHPLRLQPHAIASSSAAGETATGKINVSARGKWAMISVDGKQIGSTPIAVPDLKPGLHSVEALPLGQGPAVKRTVSVEVGKTVRVDFAFE